MALSNRVSQMRDICELTNTAMIKNPRRNPRPTDINVIHRFELKIILMMIPAMNKSKPMNDIKNKDKIMSFSTRFGRLAQLILLIDC